MSVAVQADLRLGSQGLRIGAGILASMMKFTMTTLFTSGKSCHYRILPFVYL